MSTVYLNGEFLPLEQARIPVLDRGFLFGDGVYEVIPVFGGQPFRLDEHLGRLSYSLGQCRIREPHTAEQWHSILEQLIAIHGGNDQAIYLQVTRGVAPGREHAFPEGVTPTVFAMSRPIPQPPEQPPAGVQAVVLPDIRWARCDIKSISLLGHVLLTQDAIEAGAREALLVRDGCVWEGASSNLFAVIDDTLITPPKGPYILGGITRDLLVELGRARGLRCEEAAIPEASLRRASELWITSSTREMVPVLQLDGEVVGSGQAGPVFRQLWDLYRDFRASFIREG